MPAKRRISQRPNSLSFVLFPRIIIPYDYYFPCYYYYSYSYLLYICKCFLPLLLSTHQSPVTSHHSPVTSHHSSLTTHNPHRPFTLPIYHTCLTPPLPPPFSLLPSPLSPPPPSPPPPPPPSPPLDFLAFLDDIILLFLHATCFLATGIVYISVGAIRIPGGVD